MATMPHDLTIHTARLVLRPFRAADAEELSRVINDPDIASTALNIPHPYGLADAQAFISKQPEKLSLGQAVNFGLFLRDTGELAGCVGLAIDVRHDAAELGYWIAKNQWGRGYCTEAARALIHYGLGVLGLNRIHAWHFARNPASGRVMQKLGMTHEGHSRQNIRKKNAYEDSELYAILRADIARQETSSDAGPAQTAALSSRR